MTPLCKKQKETSIMKPSDLKNKTNTVVNVKAHYNWKKQQTKIEGMKFGTYSNTRTGTSSRVGSSMFGDDTNYDSASD